MGEQRSIRETRGAADSDAEGVTGVEAPARRHSPWTQVEHLLFLLGLDDHARGAWRAIAMDYCISRTPTQVRVHYLPAAGIKQSTRVKFMLMLLSLLGQARRCYGTEGILMYDSVASCPPLAHSTVGEQLLATESPAFLISFLTGYAQCWRLRDAHRSASKIWISAADSVIYVLVFQNAIYVCCFVCFIVNSWGCESSPFRVGVAQCVFSFPVTSPLN